jgi:hypothetical protein
MMRHELTTEIEIAAPREQVWRVLSDLQGYESWNPFVVSARGTLQVGERLDVKLARPGKAPFAISPTLVAIEPGKSFAWKGKLLVPGLFDGVHRFELAQTPAGQTRLVHAESFSGLLIGPMRKMLDGATRDGFVAMNEALKRKVEAG